MKLAYLTTEYPAVSHTFIRREILALEKKGHRIHRYSIQGCKNISDPVDQIEKGKTFYCLPQGPFRLLASGIRCFLISPIKSLKALAVTLRFSRKSERGLVNHLAYFLEATLLLVDFKAKGIHHVHVHFGTNSTTVALLVSILGGPSYSFTVHGPDEFDAPRGFSLQEKISGSAFTVGISQYCSAQLKRWARLSDWEKIRIIHCTVSDDFLLPSPAITESMDTLVCVGRLSAQKGIYVLIDAVKNLIDRGYRFKLVLAGDGELRETIEGRIAMHGLKDQVTITGWVGGDRIRELIQTSRGMVLPSLAEGLPVVLMEALAMKRPVVTTCINGIPELVKDGENGFIAIAGDEISLTNCIAKLLDTPVEQLNKMGRKGHEVVRNDFSSESQMPLLEKYFSQVMSEKVTD